MRMLNNVELGATTESKHSVHNLCYVTNQVAGPRVFFPPLRRRPFSSYFHRPCICTRTLHDCTIAFVGLSRAHPPSHRGCTDGLSIRFGTAASVRSFWSSNSQIPSWNVSLTSSIVGHPKSERERCPLHPLQPPCLRPRKPSSITNKIKCNETCRLRCCRQ